MAATSSSEGLAQELARLLAAVRRRLWLAQAATAARVACWVCSGGLLVALALHLGLARVPIGALLAGLALTGLAAAVWTLRQRPGDDACALWADRHLGGASAFTTWLDLSRSPTAAPAAAARRRLERWLAAQLSASRQQLEARPASHRLTQPLLALLVCAALVSAVLSLRPDGEPAPTSAAASTPTASRDAPPLAAADPATTAIASDLARAARSAADRGVTPGTGNRTGTPAQTPDAAGAPGRADPDGLSGTTQPAGGGAAAAAPGDAPPAPGEPGRAGRGSAGQGRDLGDSRDDRADVGVSRAARGSFGVPASELPGGPAADAWRADAGESADYTADGGPAGRAAGDRLPEPAAARPPPATDSLGLSPTEASYVQAWMKASARRP
jgi:hypothetical protein